MTKADESTNATRSIVLGGGCFWCVEALFESMDGVVSVKSGYAGGHVPDPSYEAVCSGSTGHAEVVKVDYDPKQVTLQELVDFFWLAHDPTTLNRQGADVGTQYRSAIYFSSKEEKGIIETSRAKAQPNFEKAIVTEVAPLQTFYPAENYHQDYFKNNTNAPYCQYVIVPKLKKLKQAGELD